MFSCVCVCVCVCVDVCDKIDINFFYTDNNQVLTIFMSRSGGGSE